MRCTRIEIYINESIIENGRRTDNRNLYYTCWATPLELYGKELYEAINIKYDNTIVFKARYCQKIKEMRKTNKRNYIVIFEGSEYDVYQVDFKANSKDFVYIKAKLVI